MSAQIVTYELDDSTLVKFEIDSETGFRPASPDQIAGRVCDAVRPALDAAKAILDKAKETRPDGIELKFGIKVSGSANWLVARAASEGNFEITLRWGATDSNRAMNDAGVHES
jgi:hypothetical protein